MTRDWPIRTFCCFERSGPNKEWARDPALANATHLWKCFPAKVDSCKTVKLGAVGDHQKGESV